MPGYGKRMEKYAPETTEEVDTVEKRFKMPTLPKITLVQLTLIAIVLAYAWSARKMKGAVISTILIASALLHIYDHMYRVKRGEERLFFFPEAKKEGYCGACRK